MCLERCNQPRALWALGTWTPMDTISFIQLQVHSFSDNLVHSFEINVFTDQATEAHEQWSGPLADPRLAERPRKGEDRAQSSWGWKQTWREDLLPQQECAGSSDPAPSKGRKVHLCAVTSIKCHMLVFAQPWNKLKSARQRLSQQLPSHPTSGREKNPSGLCPHHTATKLTLHLRTYGTVYLS